jgi:hypothetical protein
LLPSRLAALGHEPDLETAVDLLLAVEEPIFGIIQPALRAARANLEEFLRQAAPSALPALAQLLAGVKSMASERRQRAAELRAARDAPARAQAQDRYLELFGDETPVWDVAVPTCRETPEILYAGEKPIAPARREQWRRLLCLTREAAGLGEDDDWLYARVQAAFRRALLSLGKRLHGMGALAEPSAVFFLPLPLARSLAAGAPPPQNLQMQAAAGRADWETACRDPPPASVALDTVSVKGVGTGGRALGRVVLHQPANPRPAPGQILLAPTLLPSELPLLVAAALVTETGGPLDHVTTDIGTLEGFPCPPAVVRGEQSSPAPHATARPASGTCPRWSARRERVGCSGKAIWCWSTLTAAWWSSWGKASSETK